MLTEEQSIDNEFISKGISHRKILSISIKKKPKLK